MSSREEDREELQHGRDFRAARGEALPPVEKEVDLWQAMDAGWRLAGVDCRRYHDNTALKQAVYAARAAIDEVEYHLRKEVWP
jgi:hypothetical protein